MDNENGSQKSSRPLPFSWVHFLCQQWSLFGFEFTLADDRWRAQIFPKESSTSCGGWQAEQVVRVDVTFTRESLNALGGQEGSGIMREKNTSIHRKTQLVSTISLASSSAIRFSSLIWLDLYVEHTTLDIDAVDYKLWLVDKKRS